MNKLFLLLFVFTLSSCQHHSSSVTSAHIVAKSASFDRKKAQAQGQKYVISTQGMHTTRIAQEVLKKNGNLIDAFVAASFAISVERPQSTGLGGGGFLLYHDAKTQKTYAVDFRERAPIKATRDMYLGKDKKAQPLLSQDGILAAGTPGLVKGLWEIHKKFGKLPWAEVVEPSAQLAKNGFEVYKELFEALKDRQSVLVHDPEAKKIFLNPQGEPWPVGTVLKQVDLSKTLLSIAQKGAKVFYTGNIADQFDAFSKVHNGILSKKDLQQYKVKWPRPIQGEFMGHHFFSMPPPSSGGIHVYQFLKMLEKENFHAQNLNTAENLHLEAASLQSAFADRAVHLGDPAFHKVPVKDLTDLKYIESRRKAILPAQARKQSEVQAGQFSPLLESTDTTHMSMMDHEGNAISSTQTINGWMGAGVVVPGTGILLNNEMDDFSIQPGVANLYGAVGGKANEIQPLKTPLSSMSPTLILDKSKKPVMAVGAPGGTTIISCTAKTILNYFSYKLPLWESVTNIRLHHQWSPDRLLLEEPGPGSDVVKKLQDYGYNVKVQPFICKVMAVARSGDLMTGVADPRDIGTSLGE